MKKLIANWKMNLTSAESVKLAHQYKDALADLQDKLDIIVAPSAIYFNDVRRVFVDSKIKLAGQDVASEAAGAYTGEISAKMIREYGAEFAIVWHSERRCILLEKERFIPGKLTQCYKENIIPILCVGETLPEKMAGESDGVIVRQLHKALEKVKGLPEHKLVIAYEPVWAIGTKHAVAIDELQSIIRVIKRVLSNLYSEKFFRENVELIYGGSVDETNVKDFLGIAELSGLLVGNASLNVESFGKIAAAMKVI